MESLFVGTQEDTFPKPTTEVVIFFVRHTHSVLSVIENIVKYPYLDFSTVGVLRFDTYNSS